MDVAASSAVQMRSAVASRGAAAFTSGPPAAMTTSDWANQAISASRATVESTANSRSTRGGGGGPGAGGRFRRSPGGAGDRQHAEHVQQAADGTCAHHALAEEDRHQAEHGGRGEAGAARVHRHRRASRTRVVANSATQV